MRGKPNARENRQRFTRITPAHAGKTTPERTSQYDRSDHPRACGENIYAVVIDDEATGSPPRMRGKPFAGGGGASEGRITPAHAGKTQCAANVWLQDADHPRACGENLALTLSPLSNPGSPPRMRGKPSPSPALVPRARITPAHAGKTRRMCWPTRASADHPRACGENE